MQYQGIHPLRAKHFEELVIACCNQKSQNFSTGGNREVCSRVTQDLGSHLVSLFIIQITQTLMKILFSVQMFGGIPWQVYFQRALACKTPRKAQIVSFVASLCCLLMPIPAVLIGAVGVKTGKVRSECSLRQIRTLLGRPLTCEGIRFFGLQFHPRRKTGGREATTGNTSAVCRLAGTPLEDPKMQDDIN